MTKIMFVNAIPDSKTAVHAYPIGFFYMLSNIKKELANEVECHFAYKNVDSEIDKINPDLLLISSPSCGYSEAIRIGKLAKNKNIPSIIGGCHISTLPNSLSKTFTFGVVGECEYRIIDILKHFMNHNKSFNIPKLSSMKGLVYWENEKLVQTEKPCSIENIDLLPLPDRSPIIGTEIEPFIFGSRGCTFKCAYCAGRLLSSKVRWHSAEYLMADLKQVLKIIEGKSNHVVFIDDLFTANLQRIEDFIKLLEKENLLGKITLQAQTRADCVNPELVSMFKRMGVTLAMMGLDTGNNESLTYLKGGHTTIETNYKAVKLFKDARIATHSCFIIGSPKETHEQIQQTYDFMVKSGLTLQDAGILVPLPGTTVWKEAMERGLVSESEDFDWARVNYQRAHSLSKPILMSEKLTYEELSNWLLKFQRLKIRMMPRVLQTDYRKRYFASKKITQVASLFVESIARKYLGRK